MGIQEFTKAYRTTDGSIFVDKQEAEAHEESYQILKAIERAAREARHDDYGCTLHSSSRFKKQLAMELVKAGFRAPCFDSSKWTGR